MLDLLIHRKWRKDTYTIGRFFARGKLLFNSLEDKDRGLASFMAEETIKALKVPGKTAIPLGTYRLVLTVSEKFKTKAWAKKYGGLVPEIVGVPGYSGVRIHPGNKDTDTEGCPLVGDNTAVGKLTNSVKRYCELMDNYIMPAHEKGETMEITIM